MNQHNPISDDPKTYNTQKRPHRLPIRLWDCVMDKYNDLFLFEEETHDKKWRKE